MQHEAQLCSVVVALAAIVLAPVLKVMRERSRSRDDTPPRTGGLTSEEMFRSELNLAANHEEEQGDEGEIDDPDTDPEHDEPAGEGEEEELMGIEVPPPTEAPSNVSCPPGNQETKDTRPGLEKLFDKPEKAKGPETEEERKVRLTREAMLAHTRMEVFRSFYERSKRDCKEMMEELGLSVDDESVRAGRGLFEEDEECDYSPTTLEEVEAEEIIPDGSVEGQHEEAE